MQTFDEACNDVVATLVPHGFSYRKTKRRAFRQGNLFDHLVSFATSRTINSIPGQVHLSINALARSDELAAHRRTIGWRVENAEPYLFDVPIENIWRPAPPFIRYEVGASLDRGEVLAHIKQVLLSEVLPFFELIEQPAALQETLAKKDIPALSDEAVQHYVGHLRSTVAD
jgi:hypothetical protein